MKFIKKKGDGSWEKLSTREGKTIKLGLEEVIMILEVLKKKMKSWSTVHSFKEDKTQISVSWEGESKIWFNVGDYPKMLTFAQIEILKLLIVHLLKEKIEFATTSDIPKIQVNTEKSVPKKQGVLELTVIEEIDSDNKLQKVEGTIAGETEKAVLLKLSNGAENWFPKSTIKSQYSLEKETSQTFLIDSWIIERNKINIEG
ncbi:MAG: hypothetical protein ACFFE4_08425 [Candidatus Thorarchaeota archaeon]